MRERRGGLLPELVPGTRARVAFEDPQIAARFDGGRSEAAAIGREAETGLIGGAAGDVASPGCWAMSRTVPVGRSMAFTKVRSASRPAAYSVRPSRAKAIALLLRRGRVRRRLPSGEKSSMPARASQASHSPVGDHSMGMRHVGALAMTWGDMFAPTSTIAGCHGRSRCIRPAMELPSGDQVGETIYSLAIGWVRRRPWGLPRWSAG